LSISNKYKVWFTADTHFGHANNFILDYILLHMPKEECYCVICNEMIGKFYPSQSRKTCSTKCYRKLVSVQVSKENNPNYKHGKTYGNVCEKCGAVIHPSAKHCHKCRSELDNSFKGKKHTNSAKEAIGKASSDKFTEDYVERIYRSKSRGTKHISAGGYVLVKSYDHPNRDSHNDVQEHILMMSNYLGRPINRGEIVHHINADKTDNRLDNLYLYSNASEHGQGHGSLNKLLKELMRLNIVMFEKGEYKMVEGVRTK